MFSNYSSMGKSRTQHAARKGLNKRWWADVGRATAMPNIRDTPPPLKTLVNPVTMRRARSIVTPIGHKGPWHFVRARLCTPSMSPDTFLYNVQGKFSCTCFTVRCSSTVRYNFHDFPLERKKMSYNSDGGMIKMLKIWNAKGSLKQMKIWQFFKPRIIRARSIAT